MIKFLKNIKTRWAVFILQRLARRTPFTEESVHVPHGPPRCAICDGIVGKCGHEP